MTAHSQGPIGDFSRYLQVIRNRSPRTVEEYQIDLTLFFRYLLATEQGLPYTGEAFDQMDISPVTYAYLEEKVQADDLYGFLSYASVDRQNKPRSMARKLSALRAFYRYATVTVKRLQNNPAKDIQSPAIRPALPKFLSLEESIHLLETVQADTDSPTRTRDYTMLTLFLNCGMRLNELVGLNLSDLDPDLRSLRVLGKGSKERILYLNEACRRALTEYLPMREVHGKPLDANALFLTRLRRRISDKMVQYTVKKYLEAAGYGNRRLSTHKLRHTAATLMYRHGKVDVRVLKDILGHEQLNTTQIYTHVSSESMEEAMEKNPLSTLKK